MDSTTENLKNVINVWRTANRVEVSNDLHAKHISDLVASVFSPGKNYYFILNFFDLRFEYIHPTVEEIVGCKPEDFSFDLIFEKMHPEDAAKIRLKESAATEFFYHRIPVEKIPFYKSTYTFRLSDGNGGWKTILHQSIALQIAENGRIHFVLSVHTDVSYLNIYPDDRISFIGINGEPSYFALSTDPATLLQSKTELKISPRQQVIIRLLAEGLSSKQIALQLQISQHTVDTHRRNLLKKTGAKNTLELAVECLKKGLV